MDLTIFQLIHKFGAISSILDGLAVITAKYLPYVMVIVAAFLLLRMKDWRKRTWVVLVLFFALIASYGFLSLVIHYFYGRPRPFTTLGFTPPFPETSTSFPSNHATFFFTIAYAMFLVKRKYGYWFLTFAVLNGLARVFVGVHWPLDIAGGALIALIGYLLAVRVFPEKEYIKDGSSQ